jgi:hypothetical protein
MGLVQLTHADEGVKNSLTPMAGAATLVRLVVLFCLEKAG